MRGLWASFTVAWQLLTIFPLPGKPASIISPGSFGSSLGWFPVVGFLFGGGLLLLDHLLKNYFPPVLLNMILLGIYVLVSGCLHVDGWADTVDALAGGKDVEHRLTILHDSRIGAIGATGLMLLLGLRYAGFLTLPLEWRNGMLLCMPAVGRWAMVMGSRCVVYPRSQGLAAPFIRNGSWRNTLAASLIVGVGLSGVFGVLPAVVLMAGAWVVIRWSVWWLSGKFGGITGDLLGAINEGIEILFLIVAPSVLLLSWPQLTTISTIMTE